MWKYYALVALIDKPKCRADYFAVFHHSEGTGQRQSPNRRNSITAGTIVII